MASVDRICAVVFTVLLVLSMVTPAALAADPAMQDGGRALDVAPPGGQSNDETDPIDENASSIELRVQAYQLLENATIRGGPRANERLQERVNDTFEYYVGPNRATNVRLFDRDTQVIARTKQTAPEVADRLLASQARLAETTMADANRTVNALEARGADFNLRRARQQLEAAQRQYEVGEERRERGQSNAAIAGYRQSFTRSDRLMDRLQQRTDPEVELESRADPIRNGSANYTLRGSVFAVRSGQLENLTVTVNGDSREIPLRRARAPATRVAFSTTLELESQTATVEIEAETQSERGNRVVGSDSVTLLLDGDGLSETVERQTTQTDPLDADSDSSLTDRNEADDGVVDGAEDFDADYLTTVIELEAGLDPLVNDTDADGLLDGDELHLLPTDPLDEDTDNDSVLDGDEDPDGDGLTIAEELEAGSHYNSTDGDRDGLTDPEELELGTDPLLADTDDDGLADASELDVGTDPLDNDTDDDGILDGNETFTTSVGNDSLNASVTFTGPGDVAGDASVTNETRVGLRNDLVDPARATELIRLDARQSFDTATVTFTYDQSAVPTNESDLAVYRLNHTAQFYEPVNSTVDAANDTISGRTDQTGVYTVLSPTVLAEQFTVDQNESAAYHAESFEEPTDCEGDCGLDGGNLIVGPLGGTSGVQGTALSTSSSDVEREVVLFGGFQNTIRTVTVPADATEMTVSATVSGYANSQSSATFRAGGTNIYTIASGSVSDQPVSGTVSVSGGESVDLVVSGRTGAGMSVSDISISYDRENDDEISVDLCQTVPGDQGRECPDSAVSVYSIPVERNVANLTITGSGSATVIGDNSEVAVEVGGVRDEVLASATSNGTLSFSKTYRNISRSISSEELTLSIETTGLAGARLDGITIWKDTDGDGFTDQRERIGFETSFYGRISTDPLDPDTDGDGISDGYEIGELVSNTQTLTLNGVSQSSQVEQYTLNSSPIRQDTDGDRLNDSAEYGNWSVAVVRRNGDVYRWDNGDPLTTNETQDTVRFTSDPMWADTDGDGLTDYRERMEFHTDPESQETYEITQEHQREIIGIVDDMRENHARNCFDEETCLDSLRYNLEVIGLISETHPTADSLGELEEYRLTDRTDDFDFVVADDYESMPEDQRRFGFTALDGTQRTDVWLSNGDERGLIDPWDPDSDDDGLTDGQEILGMTRLADDAYSPNPVVIGQSGTIPRTEALDPDSDGDGWWDGWIGVHDVGRTDNVLLYRENLKSNGVSGSEIVSEQTGVHNVTGTSVPGATLPGQNGRYHSNVHVGELHWRDNDPSQQGDPTDPAVTPDPSLDVEVDYFESMDLVDLDWFDMASRSYALYGIDVEFDMDDQLTHDDLQCALDEIGCLDTDTPPTSLDDAVDIESTYHDDESAVYMFVSPDGDENPGPIPDYAPNVDGVASNQGSDSAGLGFGALVFVDDHTEGPRQTYLAKTTTHEIGHIIGAGRADDGTQYLLLPREIYSGYTGSNEDPTPERVILNGSIRQRWSVMSSGWNNPLNDPPMAGRYFAFSVEELMTIEFNEMNSVDS